MNKKFVLSLGSGALRGFVHLGVYRALFENCIKIDAIYGTSVGGLVGAFISEGWEPTRLINFALDLSPLDLLDITLPNNGYIKGNKLNKFVKTNIKARNIEDLPIPLTIVAVKARTGEAEFFQHGLLSDRIQASSAIPNVFKPVIIDGTEYLDGDLCSPVPIKKAREDYPNAIIMAVNIIPTAQQALRESKNWASLISRTIYRQTLIANEKTYADFFLNPDTGYNIGFSKKAARERVELGYHQTLAIIPQLKQFMAPV